MGLLMPTPRRNPKTGIYELRVRVRATLRERFRGTIVSLPVGNEFKSAKMGAEVKVSLGTRDRELAKKLFTTAYAALLTQWDAMERGPTPLTQKQVQGLAGKLYHELVGMMDAEPGSSSIWTSVIKLNERQREAASLEQWFGPTVDELLARETVRTDAESRERLIEATYKAIQQAATVNLRKAEGDYSPDDGSKRFPEWRGQQDVPARSAEGLDLFFLLDHKFKTQSKASGTKEDYRRALNEFVALAGHSDARKVTRDQVRDWRDKMIKEDRLSKKTINAKKLTALKAVLTHGMKEHNLPTNEAHHIQDGRDDPAPTGSKSYSHEQANMILAATFKGSTKALSAPHRRAIFWVPWICAYTGLRVSEVTQLQGRNVREHDGVPYLLITPEDGSTKGKRAWTVGIHKHLVELGLLDMFKAIGDGPAFYAPYPDGADLTKLGAKHRAKDSGTRVSDWIKEILGSSAPGGRPNHAWRHLFTTQSRKHPRMDKETRDYMMGSSSKTDAREGYGDWHPTVTDREINKLPRFSVVDAGFRPSLDAARPSLQRPKRGARNSTGQAL